MSQNKKNGSEAAPAGTSPLSRVKFQVDWPSPRRFQMIGLGLNAVDTICVIPHYPAHNAKVRIRSMQQLGGGQAATACALCARYGLKVRYLGRVGDDEIGRFSLGSLAQEPMDISCIQTVAGARSQSAVIMVDEPSGGRTIFWDRDDKLMYGRDELKRDEIVQGQLLHLDGHDQPASIQAAQWAAEAGMKVCLDIDKVQPGVEELLELTDFALPTVNFATLFARTDDWRKALLQVQERVGGFVACTRGPLGCAAVWEGQIHQVPSFQVRAVDTTGAGDVFHGAFVYSLFQDWTVWKCLRFANAAGALAATRLGARGGIPALQEILALLGESPADSPPD